MSAQQELSKTVHDLKKENKGQAALINELVDGSSFPSDDIPGKSS